VKYILKIKYLKKKFHTKVLEFLTNALNNDTRLTERKYGRALKLNFKILNGNLYFLFNILITDIEIFSKHHNETLSF